MAVVAVALISCEDKKKEEGGETPTPVEKKVVLSDNELDLPQSGTYDLAAVLSPAASLEIVWTSSNEKVALVEEGTVYGVAPGTALIIASAEGYKADTCVVTVYDPYERFTWAGWELWNYNKDEAKQPIILNDTPRYVHLTSGDSVRCILASAYALVWGEGIDFVEDHLEGAGYIAQLNVVPVYMIQEEAGSKWAQYNGMFIGSSYLDIVKYSEFSTDSAYTAAAAVLIDPAQHFAYLTDQTGTAPKGIDGACLTWINFNDDEDYWPYEGLMGTGVLANIDDEIYYNTVVGWSDGYYGLAVTQTAEGLAFVQPYTFANFTAYQYKKIPGQSAPAKAPVRPTATKSHYKSTAAKLNVKALKMEKQIKAPFQIAK